jgi:hypothetical protein
LTLDLAANADIPDRFIAALAALISEIKRTGAGQIGAAPQARDLAAMRLAIAFGLALLLAPIALGALADEAGLGPAHLALPALIMLAYAAFFVGQALQKRAALAIAE